MSDRSSWYPRTAFVLAFLALQPLTIIAVNAIHELVGHALVGTLLGLPGTSLLLGRLGPLAVTAAIPPEAPRLTLVLYYLGGTLITLALSLLLWGLALPRLHSIPGRLIAIAAIYHALLDSFAEPIEGLVRHTGDLWRMAGEIHWLPLLPILGVAGAAGMIGATYLYTREMDSLLADAFPPETIHQRFRTTLMLFILPALASSLALSAAPVGTPLFWITFLPLLLAIPYAHRLARRKVPVAWAVWVPPLPHPLAVNAAPAARRRLAWSAAVLALASALALALPRPGRIAIGEAPDLPPERYVAGIARYPHRLANYEALGRHFLRRGEVVSAIAIFQEQARRAPLDAGAHLSLGEAYLAAGRWARSEAQFLRSLELDPHSTDARTFLERARQRRPTPGAPRRAPAGP